LKIALGLSQWGMLGLIHPSDPAWSAVAEAHLDVLLSDHAHCEVKAAQSALSLVGRFGGEAPQLVEPMVALAREEASHFEQVVSTLSLRQYTLMAPRSDTYVVKLKAASKRTRGDTPGLMDRLLVGALIEGRSCERFHILSRNLRDASLRQFYQELMRSEARHFTLFSSLSKTIFGKDETLARFRVLADLESEAIRSDAPTPTVHG